MSLNLIGKGLIIVMVLFLIYLFYQALTTPKMVSLDNAVWECSLCSMPSSLCINPTNLERNCTWTCQNSITNKTITETTKCTKENLVKYLEESK